MKTRLNLMLLCLGMVLGAMGFVSCRSDVDEDDDLFSSSNPIVGTWEKNDSRYLEFKKDGTFTDLDVWETNFDGTIKKVDKEEGTWNYNSSTQTLTMFYRSYSRVYMVLDVNGSNLSLMDISYGDTYAYRKSKTSVKDLTIVDYLELILDNVSVDAYWERDFALYWSPWSRKKYWNTNEQNLFNKWLETLESPKFNYTINSKLDKALPGRRITYGWREDSKKGGVNQPIDDVVEPNEPYMFWGENCLLGNSNDGASYAIYIPTVAELRQRQESGSLYEYEMEAFEYVKATCWDLIGESMENFIARFYVEIDGERFYFEDWSWK